MTLLEILQKIELEGELPTDKLVCQGVIISLFSMWKNAVDSLESVINNEADSDVKLKIAYEQLVSFMNSDPRLLTSPERTLN